MSACTPKSVSMETSVSQLGLDGVISATGYVDGVTWVKLIGEIDLSTATDLTTVFDRIEADRRIIVDCSDVPFMDCSGLRILVRYSTRAKAVGGSLHVRNPSDEVNRLLRLASLDDLLDT